MQGAARAAACLLLRQRRTSAARGFSSIPSPCPSIFSDSYSLEGHSGFIRKVAASEPPKHLPHLLRVLEARGDSVVSPGARKGFIPLAVPLARSRISGAIIALLRWPTAPSGMEMPVVEVRSYGVWLLANTVDQFIHRVLVEDDAKMSSQHNEELFHAAADAGKNLYARGDFAKAQTSDLDFYLLKKVGWFPDVMERKAMAHLEKGDHVSALIAAEFYAKKEHFPGFGRPFAFNAELLAKVGRQLEAKDAARGALKSPWWTLGCRYQDVAQIAEWNDKQINRLKDRVTAERREEDLNKGKDPAQIALDEAALWLNLASVDGTWDESLEMIAQCYREAGLLDIASFIEYRD